MQVVSEALVLGAMRPIDSSAHQWPPVHQRITLALNYSLYST